MANARKIVWFWIWNCTLPSSAHTPNSGRFVQMSWFLGYKWKNLSAQLTVFPLNLTFPSWLLIFLSSFSPKPQRWSCLCSFLPCPSHPNKSSRFCLYSVICTRLSFLFHCNPAKFNPCHLTNDLHLSPFANSSPITTRLIFLKLSFIVSLTYRRAFHSSPLPSG